MPDLGLGLLSGITKGLSEGVDSYKENSRYIENKAQLDALKKLQFRQAGYDFNPVTQELFQTPQGLLDQQSKQYKSQLEANEGVLKALGPDNVGGTQEGVDLTRETLDIAKKYRELYNPQTSLEPQDKSIFEETEDPAPQNEIASLEPTPGMGLVTGNSKMPVAGAENPKGLTPIEGYKNKKDREFDQFKRKEDYKNKNKEGKRTNSIMRLSNTIQEQILNDPIIKTYTQTLNNGLRAQNLINPNRPTTYQELNDAMMEYSKAISGSGQVTDSKLERTEFDSAQGKLAKFVQFWTGKPQDAVPPKIKAKALSLIEELNDTINSQIVNRAESKRKLFNDPDLNEAQDFVINNLKTKHTKQKSESGTEQGLIMKNPGIPDSEWNVLSPENKQLVTEKFKNAPAK